MKRQQAEKLIDKVRSLCLKLPEVKEVEAWGHPTFRAPKKMFAACGIEESGEATLGMKMSFERQEMLLEDKRFFPTPYAARMGWVSIQLSSKTKWKEIENLVEEAYRQVAHKKLIKFLDEKS